MEAASAGDRTSVCQGADTGSLARAMRCCLCHRQDAASLRASSSQSRACLRPANLQSRRLGWRPESRETELPAGGGTRAPCRRSSSALSGTALPSRPWRPSPRQGTRSGGSSTTLSPAGRETAEGSGWHGRQAGRPGPEKGGPALRAAPPARASGAQLRVLALRAHVRLVRF